MTTEATTLEYLGNELELFQEATCWKTYFASHLRPYLTGRVLEVGAGIGGTSRVLCRSDIESWTMLEPDPGLARRLQESLGNEPLPIPYDVRIGTTDDLQGDAFSALLYIDVIEHIEFDAAELERAAGLLVPGGHLIILVPAHQWLYTPFDKAIGHFRRYSRSSLRAVIPSSLQCQKLIYLDSVGLLASLANRLLLNAAVPTRRQIQFWDKVLVRSSRWMDPLLLHSIGKSVVGVWRKPE